MTYLEIRNLLALMTRGSSIPLPHPKKTIEVLFDTEGFFHLSVSYAETPSTVFKTKSLKEMTNYVHRFYTPAPEQIYQHINGNTYVVLAIANEESMRPEYPPTVVYQGLNNKKVWAKPLENFLRKMTRIK